MIETKTSKAVNYWLEGKQLQAFRIFKTFKLGFSKEDRNTIITTYEILSGHGDFYKQLGKDINQIVAKGNMIIRDFIDEYKK